MDANGGVERPETLGLTCGARAALAWDAAWGRAAARSVPALTAAVLLDGLQRHGTCGSQVRANGRQPVPRSAWDFGVVVTVAGLRLATPVRAARRRVPFKLSASGSPRRPARSHPRTAAHPALPRWGRKTSAQPAHRRAHCRAAKPDLKPASTANLAPESRVQ